MAKFKKAKTEKRSKGKESTEPTADKATDKPKVAKKRDEKKRNWAFVCYPDSLPENWIEIIRHFGVQAAISPLHDKDCNPDDKEKKPHYHVIVTCDGPTTFSNVCTLAQDKLNGAIPIGLQHPRGYYRYLTHKDNPEKYQYPENEIILINDFAIEDFMERTRSEVQTIKIKVHEFIRNHAIFEYCDLLDMLLDNDLHDELEIANNNTMLFNSYIRSRRHKAEKGLPLQDGG
jgi:hypothetical protein